MLDDSNLVIEASGRRSYHMTLSRRARGLSSSRGIAFDTTTSRVCARFSQIMFASQMDGDSIRIASIRELNKDELETLLIQYGKKKPEIEQTPVPNEVPGAEVEELDPAASDQSTGN